jgi:endonuclease YncB( thermonuclease family)
LRDGTLVNSEIIKAGYGFAYLSFNFTKLDEFKSLEEQAEHKNLGLWDSCEIETGGGYINTAPEST